MGGLIEEEPTQSGGDYVSAVNLQYRVWIVPKVYVDTFEASKRESLLSADASNTQKEIRNKIRTYPAQGFASTNSEGEFFQENGDICYEGERIYLEFKGKSNGKETLLFAGPVKPSLPFTDVTITYADYFNDFITGKVEPKRLIKWSSNRFNPDEEQQELVYYKGPVDISPFNDYGVDRSIIGTSSQSHRNDHRDYVINGTAHVITDEQGEFDTRNAALDLRRTRCC